jgi:hypothetical protein
MPQLKTIDLSNTSIVSYSGSYGTGSGSISYLADSVPVKAFKSKTTLTSVFLPASVTAICDSAFNGCRELETMPLPSSLVSIGERSFYSCGDLKNINFPTSLTTIGDDAFFRCDSLKHVNLPSSLTFLGNSAFSACEALISVTIPSSVTTMNPCVFANCHKLQTVDFSASVLRVPSSTFYNCFELSTIEFNSPGIEEIENLAFNNCTSLVSITLPATLKVIDNNAFNDCSSLQSIDLSDSITYIGEYSFHNSGLKSIILPEGLTKINERAFKNSALTSVNLPATLTTIARECFYGCTNLDTLYVNNPQPASINQSDSVFAQVDKENCLLFVPGGTCSQYKAAEVWKDFKNIIDPEVTLHLTAAGTLSDSLSSRNIEFIKKLTLTGEIDARDFRIIRDSMPVIESLDISGVNIVYYYGELGTLPSENGHGANRVPPRALLNNKTLCEVKLPESAIAIDSYAFQNCTNLASVSIPGSVTTIGWYVFSGCSSLTTFSIPASVTKIYYNAFENCTALASLYAYPTIPIDLSNQEDVFKNVDTVNCVLHVPESSVDLYSTADKWKSFMNIEDDLPKYNLEASQSSVSFDASETTKQVSITSNVTWTAVSDQSWLTVSPGSGTGDADISLSVTVNTSSENRTAILILSSVETETDTINVTQSGKTTGILPTSYNNTEVIYPNPASEFINISIETMPHSRLTVYNLQGKQVLETALEQKSQIDISHLNSGVYLYRLFTGEDIYSGQIIKQ